MMGWLWRCFVLLVMFILTLYPLAAQDEDFDSDLLLVLQPEDVLVDGVEVIETLPELNVIGLSNDIYLLAPDADGWVFIPSPDEVAAYSDYYMLADRLPNGNFEISVTDSDMVVPCPDPTPTFEFSPETRQFTMHEFDGELPDPRLFWGLFYSSAPENIRLRNYCELNWFGAELPDDMSNIIRSNMAFGESEAAQMNTTDYLVVAAPAANDAGDYLFAVYTVDGDRWGESFPLHLPGDWTFDKLGFEDSVLYFSATDGETTLFYTLDIPTKTFYEVLQLPYPQPLYPGEDGVYYYVGYDETDYQIYQYDLFAQREDIIAEFPCSSIGEGCTELSIQDTNRWTDMTDLMFVLRGAESEEGVLYVVVDAIHSDLLYRGLFSSEMTGIRWLDNDESGLLLDFYQDGEEPYTVMVDLSTANPDGDPLTIPYRVLGVSPDGQRAVVPVVDAEDGTQTVGIVDLETLAYRPITLPLDTNAFRLSAFWRADNTLQVTVYSLSDEFFSYVPAALHTWIIQA